MKFTIEKRLLNEAVSNLQRAVSNKTSIPALEGILIRSDVEKIILSAYDLEIGMQTELPAVISESGAIILTAKLFSEIVRKSPAEDVTIETDDRKTATITSGVSCFTIIGMDAAEFPEFPKITDTDTVRLPANLLKSMIRQTIFAVADSNAKPIHQGSLFKIENNTLDVVSVDGYRLALRREAIQFDGELDFVVPGKTLSEVLKLLRDDDSDVEICPSRRHILFKIDNYTVLSALLEGEFLDYRAALPKDHKTEVVVSTRTLIDSVERVSLLITDRLKSPVRYHTVRIKISKIEPAPFFTSHPDSRDSVRRIRIQPSIRLIIESCPVMVADMKWCCIQSCLPCCWNACHTTQSNECQCLYATITLQ